MKLISGLALLLTMTVMACCPTTANPYYPNPPCATCQGTTAHPAGYTVQNH